jgi:hypothetical protein
MGIPRQEKVLYIEIKTSDHRNTQTLLFCSHLADITDKYYLSTQMHATITEN